MMIAAEIQTARGEITLEVSDYGCLYLCQGDDAIEFEETKLPELIAALEKQARFLR